ncbi:MAG TPA: DnaJ domain-containing protein [Chitinophagaceae bacterium]|nr:DnaJ domain-containing protein [Chitinophagaceae bacterium]
MKTKDYYKVLDVAHTADLSEIKKAYRQLVMKYHPDKTGNNGVATAQFREISEAYHILSDPHRRSAYNQQRWYNRMNFSRQDAEPISPASMLEKSRKLNRYVATLDSSRINEPALYQYIEKLLSESSVNMLINTNELSTKQLFITEMLKATHPLSYAHLQIVTASLVRVAGNDQPMVDVLQKNLKEKRLSDYWQRYQAVIILLIAIVICCIIYLAGN